MFKQVCSHNQNGMFRELSCKLRCEKSHSGIALCHEAFYPRFTISIGPMIKKELNWGRILRHYTRFSNIFTPQSISICSLSLLLHSMLHRTTEHSQISASSHNFLLFTIRNILFSGSKMTFPCLPQPPLYISQMAALQKFPLALILREQIISRIQCTVNKWLMTLQCVCVGVLSSSYVYCSFCFALWELLISFAACQFKQDQTLLN